MSQLLTIAEVCDHFGIDRATLYRWRKAGKISPSKICDKRFNRAEFEALSASKK